MRNFWKINLFCIFIVLSFLGGWVASNFYNSGQRLSFGPEEKQEKVKIYEKYSIENLSAANIEPGIFDVSEKTDDNEKYTSYLFNFRFKPDLKNEKNISGQINIPSNGGPFPAILMIRGYVNQNNYRTGDGTRNAAKFFAENGYITISPDFLGYGSSDSESGNIFETRFQTYVTAITLLKNIATGENPNIKTDNVGIWAHSNGGQIALNILEITGKSYPTVLWAPVSKPFPYSVLYYTDDSDDGGKLIRKELSKFEADYDTDKYSLTEYSDKINAPILLQQGDADEAVPKLWSDSLYYKLHKLEKDIQYVVYPDTDHNMRPSWNDAVVRDLEFYKSKFSEES